VRQARSETLMVFLFSLTSAVFMLQ
jgi:hypothetical protein